MERRRVKGLLLLLLLLLLLVYNLLIVPPLGFHLHEGKKASSEEIFTTSSDSPISQKRHSGDENKAGSTQNNASVTKNKAADELGSSAKETNNLSLTKNNFGSSARETNNLRLQHLARACEEEELAQYKKFLPNLRPKEDLLKVDPELRLAVCVPYKAGSETWRYLLGGETISNLQQVCI